MMNHIMVTVAGTLRPVLQEIGDGHVFDLTTLAEGTTTRVNLPTLTTAVCGKPIWICNGKGVVVITPPADQPVDGRLSSFRIIGMGHVHLMPLPEGSSFKYSCQGNAGVIAYPAPLFPDLYWDDSLIWDDYNIWAEELPFIIE